MKALRQHEKLSLEKVAQLTGVSKTMIGQIERGESSPTLATIWKIANGLKVSFSTLIEQQQETVQLKRKNQQPQLVEDDGKYRISAIFPFDVQRRFEIYDVEMDVTSKLQSEAHREGTEEFLTIYEGQLTLFVGDETFHLNEGDAIRFKADVAHCYENRGETLLKLAMTIYYI